MIKVTWVVAVDSQALAPTNPDFEWKFTHDTMPTATSNDNGARAA